MIRKLLLLLLLLRIIGPVGGITYLYLKNNVNERENSQSLISPQ